MWKAFESSYGQFTSAYSKLRDKWSELSHTKSADGQDKLPRQAAFDQFWRDYAHVEQLHFECIHAMQTAIDEYLPVVPEDSHLVAEISKEPVWLLQLSLLDFFIMVTEPRESLCETLVFKARATGKYYAAQSK